MLRIRLISYCGFLLIYALLGIATVYERSAATALRYQLAKQLRAERELDEQFARAKVILGNLREPARLEKIAARVSSPLVPLAAMGALSPSDVRAAKNSSPVKAARR